MGIVKLTVRLPGGVHQRLKHRAQEENRSLNRIIVQAVEMLLQKNEVDYQQLSEYDRTMLVLRESSMLEPMGLEWDKYLSGEPLMTADDIRTALRGIPLHPTQIYESLTCVGIYIFLVRLRRRQKFDGQVWWAFLIIYALMRSLIEVFRFDVDRGVYLGGLLSTSQIISLLVLTAAAIMLPLLARKARRNGSYGVGPAWPWLKREHDLNTETPA